MASKRHIPRRTHRGFLPLVTLPTHREAAAVRSLETILVMPRATSEHGAGNSTRPDDDGPVRASGDARHMESCIWHARIFRGPFLLAYLLTLTGGCATKVIFHDHTHHQAGEGGEGAEAAAPTSGRGGATNSNGGASATA